MAGRVPEFKVQSGPGNPGFDGMVQFASDQSLAAFLRLAKVPEIDITPARIVAARELLLRIYSQGVQHNEAAVNALIQRNVAQVDPNDLKAVEEAVGRGVTEGMEALEEAGDVAVMRLTEALRQQDKKNAEEDVKTEDSLPALQQTKKGQKRVCSACPKTANKVCSACKGAFYCSLECQQKNWNKHKGVCQLSHQG